jgi:tRNA pseudouridine32 synthase/23S rRNA pseudouridine746 synthase
LHLHAREVRVPLYPRRPAVTVQAPLPEHLQGTLHSLGLLERVADAAEPLSRAEAAADPR